MTNQVSWHSGHAEDRRSVLISALNISVDVHVAKMLPSFGTQMPNDHSWKGQQYEPLDSSHCGQWILWFKPSKCGFHGIFVFLSYGHITPLCFFPIIASSLTSVMMSSSILSVFCSLRTDSAILLHADFKGVIGLNLGIYWMHCQGVYLLSHAFYFCWVGMITFSDQSAELTRTWIRDDWSKHGCSTHVVRYYLKSKPW